MDIDEKQGHVYEIMDLDVRSERFQKQEFVITVKNGSYTEYLKFQCLQEKTSLLADIQKGDMVEVRYRVSGRKVDGQKGVLYFTNLDVIDIMTISSHTEGPGVIRADDDHDYTDVLPGLKKEEAKIPSDEPDDLPF